jgi:AcrR family transcriptional regulator
METRRHRTAATQIRLLDAAEEVLAEVGVDRLSMQAVADRADVALRTLYNHFPSRDALVVQTFTLMASDVQDAVSVLPAAGSPRERLDRLVDTFFDFYERQTPGYAAILGVTGVPEFNARVAEVRAWRRSELTAVLRPAARAGSLRVPLKQAVALAFLWTAFATFDSLVTASGLPPTAAKQLAHSSIGITLFEPREPR